MAVALQELGIQLQPCRQAHAHYSTSRCPTCILQNIAKRLPLLHPINVMKSSSFSLFQAKLEGKSFFLFICPVTKSRFHPPCRFSFSYYNRSLQLAPLKLNRFAMEQFAVWILRFLVKSRTKEMECEYGCILHCVFCNRE